MADSSNHLQSPLQSPPLRPEPLTPAQQRAERVRVWAFLEGERKAGRIPSIPTLPSAPALPPAHLAPPASPAATHPAAARPIARKRFETREVRRIPVAVSEEARRVIVASSAQGRLVPQALAEVLGQHPGLARVSVDVEREQDEAGQVARTLLVITVEPTEAAQQARARLQPHTWRVNAADLAHIHPVLRHPTFNAAALAQELLRLYPN